MANSLLRAAVLASRRFDRFTHTISRDEAYGAPKAVTYRKRSRIRNLE
jgi:hypothetical protein